MKIKNRIAKQNSKQNKINLRENFFSIVLLYNGLKSDRSTKPKKFF